MTDVLAEAQDVTRSYRLPRQTLLSAPGRVQALAGVSFAVRAGSNFGIVGESGSGKSTLARIVLALEPPDSGSMCVLGRNLAHIAARELRALRRQFQMVFQDPYGSLDPRMTVGRSIAEPLPQASAAEVANALEAVALRASDAQKYPHEFSGGQRQRIAIARALITRPRLIVLDEPVSALDVSVQAQILNLFSDLQAEYGVTYLMISHDLPVVAHLCDEVAVLLAGRIVEQGVTAAVFGQPAHPYTRALLEAAPGLGARRIATADAPPAPAGGTGCVYAGQCRYREGRCLTGAPVLRPMPDGRLAACHFAGQLPGTPG